MVVSSVYIINFGEIILYKTSIDSIINLWCMSEKSGSKVPLSGVFHPVSGNLLSRTAR